jgi:hypothetical protein
MHQEPIHLSTADQSDNRDQSVPVIVDVSEVDNAVLKRLISEISVEKENTLHAYNRTHNRHNRGR